MLLTGQRYVEKIIKTTLVTTNSPALAGAASVHVPSARPADGPRQYAAAGGVSPDRLLPQRCLPPPSDHRRVEVPQ
jgi:hypothetical protein